MVPPAGTAKRQRAASASSHDQSAQHRGEGAAAPADSGATPVAKSTKGRKRSPRKDAGETDKADGADDAPESARPRKRARVGSVLASAGAKASASTPASQKALALLEGAAASGMVTRSRARQQGESTSLSATTTAQARPHGRVRTTSTSTPSRKAKPAPRSAKAVKAEGKGLDQDIGTDTPKKASSPKAVVRKKTPPKKTTPPKSTSPPKVASPAKAASPAKSRRRRNSKSAKPDIPVEAAATTRVSAASTSASKTGTPSPGRKAATPKKRSKRSSVGHFEAVVEVVAPARSSARLPPTASATFRKPGSPARQGKRALQSKSLQPSSAAPDATPASATASGGLPLMMYSSSSDGDASAAKPKAISAFSSPVPTPLPPPFVAQAPESGLGLGIQNVALPQPAVATSAAPAVSARSSSSPAVVQGPPSTPPHARRARGAPHTPKTALCARTGPQEARPETPRSARSVSFADSTHIAPTWSPRDYDRSSIKSARFKRSEGVISRSHWRRIFQKVDQYKASEMVLHPDAQESVRLIFPEVAAQSPRRSQRSISSDEDETARSIQEMFSDTEDPHSFEPAPRFHGFQNGGNVAPNANGVAPATGRRSPVLQYLEETSAFADTPRLADDEGREDGDDGEFVDEDITPRPTPATQADRSAGSSGVTGSTGRSSFSKSPSKVAPVKKGGSVDASATSAAHKPVTSPINLLSSVVSAVGSMFTRLSGGGRRPTTEANGRTANNSPHEEVLEMDEGNNPFV